MHPARRAYWASVGRLVLVSCLWSTQGLAVRAVATAEPLAINALRSATMSAALLAWLALARRRPARIEAGPFLVIPVCFAVGTSLWIFALTDTSVANAVCLGATAPVWAALLAPWTLGERSAPRVWLAAVTALGGVVLIATGGGSGGLALSLRAGDLAALGNAGLFAAQAVTLRRYRTSDLLPAFALAGLAAALLDLALGADLAAMRPADVLIVSVMGVLHLAIPVLLLTRGTRDVPVVQATLILLSEILLSPLWVWLALGERPPPGTILGGGLIALGVLAATVSPAVPAAAVAERQG